MARLRDVARLIAEVRGRVRAASGSTVPELRRVRRGLSAVCRDMGPESVLEAAVELLRGETEVPRWLVYELVHHHAPSMTALDADRLLRLGEGMASWGDVDPFACYLSGPVWREGRVADAEIHRWAASPDRWWRRAALVSTVPLNNTARGGRGDAERTLVVCGLLHGDRDDMVVKAMSWALRELSKKDRGAVESHVEKYRDVLAARVVREVERKLATGLKDPRRRGRGG